MTTPSIANTHAWHAAAWNVCHAPSYSLVRRTRLRGLAYELAEAFSDDLAYAVTRFPEQVMRAWHIDHDEILVLINQKSPISQGTPRWREVEVELASMCLSAIEANLCSVCLEAVPEQLDLRLFVRRVCFESVFEYFCFLLKGTAPAV